MAQSRSKRRQGIYFPHFADMRRNPSIQAMRIVYGEKGYGWFWILVEMMREQEGYALPLSGKYSLDVIAGELKCDNKEADKFISDCIEVFHLFDWDGDSFWNEGLLQSMQLMEEVSEVKRAAANKRWGKSDPDASPVQPVDAYAMQRKKNKENKTEETELDSQDDYVESESERLAAYHDGRDVADPDYRERHGLKDPPPMHVISEKGVAMMENREPGLDEYPCSAVCFIEESYKEGLMEAFGIDSEEKFGKMVDAVDLSEKLWLASEPNKTLEAFLAKEIKTKNETKETVREEAV
jgi:hypothetical protein